VAFRKGKKMSKSKFKKAGALLLAVLLSLSALTGCSATDAGFLSLYTEISDLKSYTVSGNFEMVYEAVRIKADVSGEVAYTEPYDIYFDLVIKYGINSKDTPFSARLKLYNNVIYMPVKDYVDLSVETMRLGGLSDRMCETVKRAAFQKAGEYDYVIMFDMAEAYQMMAFNELEEAILDSLKKMFSGFSSGMTQAVPNGYALQITPEKAVSFIDNLVKHILKNKSAIYRETVNMYEMFAELMPIMDEAPDREAFDEAITMIENAYKEYFRDWDKEFYALLFKGSRANVELNKQGNRYTQKYDIDIKYKGAPLFSLKGNFIQTVKEEIIQETADTENPISLDELDGILRKAERSANYVKTAEFSWWSGGYSYDGDPFNWATVNLSLAEGRDWDYIEFANEFGALYVPMEKVWGWFGEEEAWDGEGQIVIEDVELVRLREIEKLGYSVSYEYNSDWREHTVTIRRN